MFDARNLQNRMLRMQSIMGEGGRKCDAMHMLVYTLTCYDHCGKLHTRAKPKGDKFLLGLNNYYFKGIYSFPRCQGNNVTKVYNGREYFID